MSGKRKKFSEIENEEITTDFAFYYLYTYIDNYENETVEDKRKIREYYDTELRYKGAFYRDRKYFKEHGEPTEWSLEKKKRFKISTQHSSYLSGTALFSKEFRYKSTYLVNLDLSISTNISVIDVEKGIIDIYPYEDKVKLNIDRLFKSMLRIDNSKGKIFVRKGYEPAFLYDLSKMQYIFKVLVNKYIRHFSTNFVSQTNIRTVAYNVLDNYLNGLIDLDKGIKSDELSKPSNPPDEEFSLDNVEIQRIYVIKRTTKHRIGLERQINYPYTLYQSLLTSLVIQ